jgi:hypothetical protein
MIDELASQMVDQRSEIDATISKLNREVSRRLTLQRESIDQTNQTANQETSATKIGFEQVNAKIVALESKMSDVACRAAVAAPSNVKSNILLSPSIVNQNDPSDIAGTTSNNVPTNGNYTCTCQSSTCNVSVRASVNATRTCVSV